jgi:topoisomerase IV subunit A
LLGLQIKRISKFDRTRNEEEKLKILTDLKEVKRNLRHLVPYVINYLRGILEKYGKAYKRKTQLTTAEEIDVRELTADELGIVYDRERGLLGHGLKGEAIFRCSPLDRLLVVWDNGKYQMLAPPERQFVDHNVVEVELFDRDKPFVAVYSTAGATFVKRFAFGGAIMNRDYFCIPEGAKLRLFTDRPIAELRLKYRHIKGARYDEQTFDLGDLPVRGPKTRGFQLTKRTVVSVSGK